MPKRGDIRADGKIFSRRYKRNGRWNLRWVTPERLAAENRRNADIAKVRRARNPERFRASARQWRKDNAALVRSYKNKMRAAKFGASTHGNPKAIAVFYETARRLTKCTGLPWEVDHIYPLSKGGLHHENNLQLLTKSANCRKHARI